MKLLIAVILTLILFGGCYHPPKTAVKNAPPPPPAIRPAPQPKVRENPAVALLRQSTPILREVTMQSENAVPDALLNRTRCFIFVLRGQVKGLSTCRSGAAPDSWNTPELVSLSDFGPVSSDSLIFLLSARAADALATGNLRFSQLVAVPGKTEQEKPLLTAQDLAEDAVTFVYAPPVLSGAPLLIGSITSLKPPTVHSISTTADAEEDILRPVPPDLTATYLDWVTSYFNAITPTGIIIHHTAAIPLTGKVPAGMSDVDRYHADRGLSIECFGREYHVAYHYLVLPDGSIKPGRPEHCEGAHARAYNSYIGISLVGDFSARDNPRGNKGLMRPTNRQLKSLVRLTRRLQQQYNIPVQRILRHSDVAPTMCPGDRFAFKTFLLELEQSHAHSQ